MNSQNQLILSHLKSGKPITQDDAKNLFGCSRLAARVLDLKHNGHHISSQLIDVKNRYGKTVKVAQYSLGGEV